MKIYLKSQKLVSEPFESNQTTIVKRESIVNGMKLKEFEKVTKIVSDKSTSVREIMVHKRSIGNREITVRNVKVDGNLVDIMVTTKWHNDAIRSSKPRPMNEDEIIKFGNDWTDLWVAVENESTELNILKLKEIGQGVVVAKSLLRKNCKKC